MAIYGIGAMCGGNHDYSLDCALGNYVFINCPRGKKPSIDRVFDSMSLGDIVYVKTTNQYGLYIKSVHLVVNDEIEHILDRANRVTGYKRKTICLWYGKNANKWTYLSKNIDDLHYMRMGPIYPELGDKVVDSINVKVLMDCGKIKQPVKPTTFEEAIKRVLAGEMFTDRETLLLTDMDELVAHAQARMGCLVGDQDIRAAKDINGCTPEDIYNSHNYGSR
jgi:hypothetical protein